MASGRPVMKNTVTPEATACLYTATEPGIASAFSERSHSSSNGW
jgi:hypothetical protein